MDKKRVKIAHSFGEFDDWIFICLGVAIDVVTHVSSAFRAKWISFKNMLRRN